MSLLKQKRKRGEKLWCIMFTAGDACYAKEPREAWDKIIASLRKAVNEKPRKYLETKSMRLLMVSSCGVK